MRSSLDRGHTPARRVPPGIAIVGLALPMLVSQQAQAAAVTRPPRQVLAVITQVAPQPSKGQEPFVELSIPAGLDSSVVADHIAASDARPGEMHLKGDVTIAWAKGPGQIVGQGIVREFFGLQLHAARVTVVQHDRQTPTRVLVEPRPGAPVELWVPAGLTRAFEADKVTITGSPGPARVVLEGNVRMGIGAGGAQLTATRVELRAHPARVTLESTGPSDRQHLLIELLPSRVKGE